MGAKINHKIESIFAPISSGDQIEIITSKNVSPKPEWLEHVITTKAKQAIMNRLKKDKLNNIANGIVLFEARLKDFGVTPSARVFRKVLPAYECANKDEFYSKLGAGNRPLGRPGQGAPREFGQQNTEILDAADTQSLQVSRWRRPYKGPNPKRR